MLKKSSPLQQDTHPAPRVSLTSVPSLWRGRGVPRHPPGHLPVQLSPTAHGTWLELAREHCWLLTKASVPHDRMLPPPPASPQPHAATASRAEGCGCTRGQLVGECGVGEHRGQERLEGAQGTLIAGEPLEGPHTKLLLLQLEATSPCKLGRSPRSGPQVTNVGVCFGPCPRPSSERQEPLAIQDKDLRLLH